MIESSSDESESFSAGGGGSTGGGLSVFSVLVSSFVSPLSPLCIKVRRGNGDPVMRVGLWLLVFAETGMGISSSDIQSGCIFCNVGTFVMFGIYGNLNLALRLYFKE